MYINVIVVKMTTKVVNSVSCCHTIYTKERNRRHFVFVLKRKLFYVHVIERCV